MKIIVELKAYEIKEIVNNNIRDSTIVKLLNAFDNAFEKEALKSTFSSEKLEQNGRNEK